MMRRPLGETKNMGVGREERHEGERNTPGGLPTPPWQAPFPCKLDLCVAETRSLPPPTEPHHQGLMGIGEKTPQLPLLSGGDNSEVGSTQFPRVPQEKRNLAAHHGDLLHNVPFTDFLPPPLSYWSFFDHLPHPLFSKIPALGSMSPGLRIHPKTKDVSVAGTKILAVGGRGE